MKNYYIDPTAGDAAASGVSRDKPWRSFTPLNGVALGAAYRVEIVASGAFDTSLCLNGFMSTSQ